MWEDTFIYHLLIYHVSFCSKISIEFQWGVLPFAQEVISSVVHKLAFNSLSFEVWEYSKTCVKRPLSKRPKLDFKTNYRLMQVKSIAECSKGSILQYFRPSLSYHLSLRSLFCLFLSGRFTQALVYHHIGPHRESSWPNLETLNPTG